MAREKSGRRDEFEGDFGDGEITGKVDCNLRFWWLAEFFRARPLSQYQVLSSLPSRLKNSDSPQTVVRLVFSSRTEAGHLLGEKLREYSSTDVVVLGITRGGVVVAAEVAKALRAPLYPLVVKKISSPYNPEFALGAMGPDGNVVISDQSLVSSRDIEDIKKKIEERKKALGVNDIKMAKAIKNRIVIIVDDGVATGWTLRVGIAYAQGKQAKKVIAAVPVADREVAKEIRKEVDELVVLEEVDGLGAVGNFYEEFLPVEDWEVAEILNKQRWGVDRGRKR